MDLSQDWFTSDPDWAKYAVAYGIALPSAEDSRPLDALEAAALDIPAGREGQRISQREWVQKNPLSSLNYDSHILTISVRDGTGISVKISYPNQSRLRRAGTGYDAGQMRVSLPVLFVTHGGGWIQGSHVSEEQWLLWPLYAAFNLVIVSVEYRLAPEHKFPTWIEDSWDVLQSIHSNPDHILPQSSVFTLDLQSIILAGSSAGAAITAVLSQRCRDQGIEIKGVVLNAPVLCDYRHLPREEILALTKNGLLSYEQCTTAVLSSGVMKTIWELVVPSSIDGSDPLASPLLGRLVGLPPHLIYVAGQDPLRDEGILYAQRLRDKGVSTRLNVYPGVPHVFAEMFALEATQRFWNDIREGLATLLTPISEEVMVTQHAG